jgi:hypothetical protein
MQVFRFFTIIKFRAFYFSTSLGHYWPLIDKVGLISIPYPHFVFASLSCTFLATLLFFPKMYSSFAHELRLLTILRCLLVHLTFAKPMPIISARGIRCPCYLSERLHYFYEGREIGRIWTTREYSPLSPHKFLLNFCLCNCYKSSWS